MLSEDQYNQLKPHRVIIKHVYEGGSSPKLPLDVFAKIWSDLGFFPFDLNCGECRVNLVKGIYQEMLNFENQHTVN